ncbi:MAG: hypothetical protein U1F70_04225 [Candidatus Competibacteraceae bacterium]
MNLAQFNLWVAEIHNDRRRGASELARRALELLAGAARTLPAVDAPELRMRLLSLADNLSMARPSMAPIQNLLRRWRESSIPPAGADLAIARELAAERAEALSAASRRAVTECAVHTAHLLGPGRTVMTHSLSSTVVETPAAQGRRLADDRHRITAAGGGAPIGGAAFGLAGADHLHHRRANGAVRRSGRRCAGGRR